NQPADSHVNGTCPGVRRQPGAKRREIRRRLIPDLKHPGGRGERSGGGIELGVEGRQRSRGVIARATAASGGRLAQCRERIQNTSAFSAQAVRHVDTNRRPAQAIDCPIDMAAERSSFGPRLGGPGGVRVCWLIAVTRPVRGWLEHTDANRTLPVVENRLDIAGAELDAQRPPRGPVAMAFDLQIDPPIHDTEWHSRVGPLPDQIETGPDDAYEMPGIRLREVVFNAPAVLTKIVHTLQCQVGRGFSPGTGGPDHLRQGCGGPP